MRVGLRDRLRRFPDRAQDDFNRSNFRYFDFDVLMTNPPFAGEIKDTRLLHQYDLAKKNGSRWQSSVGRDILFVERNLEFLRPGGRMCIVLPQGRLNNTTDEYIRRFIAEHARILAVVGLHGNTFKPHTGTKTSVFFLQKWNEDREAGPLCPRVEDYPVFFATSQNGGKDNSGDYIFKKDSLGAPVLDNHGHMIVERDLDVIAEGFVSFAKREGSRSGRRDTNGRLERNPRIPPARPALGPWYYQPHYLRMERELAACSTTPLGAIAMVTDGIHASPDIVDSGGVPYLSAKCVKDNRIVTGACIQISRAQHAANPRTRPKPGDVLITTVGTIGNAAVVTDELSYVNADRHLGIIRLADGVMDPYYLSTFLNSAYGRFQTLRESTGNVQLNLFIHKIKQLRVPLLPCAPDVAQLTRAAYRPQDCEPT